MSKAIVTSDLARVARELPAGQEIMRGPNHQMQVELRRLIRRREVARVSPIYMDMAHPGMVYTIVQRHKPPRPSWVRPFLIVSAALPAVLGVGYAVAMATPALVFLAVLGMVGLGVVKLTRSGRTYVEGSFRGRIVRR